MNTEFKIVFGLIFGLTIGPLFIAVAFGQPLSYETIRLSQLLTELSGYGYTEFADLTFAGDLVEFRSNGTIFINEYQVLAIVEKYGFELKEYAPAPALEEDSIIIVATRAGVSY